MKDYHYVIIGIVIVLIFIGVFVLFKKEQPKKMTIVMKTDAPKDWVSTIRDNVGMFKFPKCASCMSSPSDAQIAAGTPDYETSRLYIQPTKLACNSFENLSARIG